MRDKGYAARRAMLAGLSLAALVPAEPRTAGAQSQPLPPAEACAAKLRQFTP